MLKDTLFDESNYCDQNEGYYKANEQLEQSVEVQVVTHAYAIIQPIAVVVKIQAAPVALRAVLRALVDVHLAYFAP